MAGIPDDIIDRIKVEANIVDVISDYVRLRRTGKNWLGLCPFHDDKKPSFNVEPVKGIYKCFACGKGGNVFTFLMELNGWTFPETIRSLAQSLGIEIPEDARDQQQYSENERLSAAVRDAARFFHAVLRSDSGLTAQAYFKKREISDETITRFGLGYSMNEWDSLLKKLADSGYTSDELERAGLLIRRDGSRPGWYDRFRGRVMFPIFTATGRVIGFGARRMTEDPEQPKYINSPETAVYQKSRVLYGLFQAKDAIRKKGLALMVEGYVDVISLHQAGVETAIATCGTAMAQEHADLISRYCSRVVLVFDSDKAGQSATERGIDVLLRKGIDVAVLRLPDGEDPDTFVRKYGAKEFESRVDRSVSFLEFRVQLMKQAGDFDAPERLAESIRAIVTTVALIPDELKRELYIQKIASDYHISETLLLKELEQAVGRGERRRRRELLPKTPEPPETQSLPESFRTEEPVIEPRGQSELPLTVTQRPKPITVAQLPSAEVGLLEVLLHGDPQMLEHVFARIDPEDFAHPVTRELVGLILSHYVNQRSFSIDDLVMEEISPDLRDLVTLLAIGRESISTHWNRIDPNLTEPNPWKNARDCLIRIIRDKLEREFRRMQERTQELDHLQQNEDEAELLANIMELTRRIEDLRKTMIS